MMQIHNMKSIMGFAIVGFCMIYCICFVFILLHSDTITHNHDSLNCVCRFGPVWSGWYSEDEKRERERYYRMSGAQQASIVLAYGTLVGLLLLAMKQNNKKRLSPKQLEKSLSDPYYDASLTHTSDDIMVYDDYFSDSSSFFSFDDEQERGTRSRK
jgi:hypothetical protein